MTSCGRGRVSATRECFGRGSQGTIFIWSSNLSLFFLELCSFRRFFCFPRFCKIWCMPNVRALGLFGFDDVLDLFLKLRSVTGHLFANSDNDLEFFLKITFHFSKQSRCYLPESYGDPQAEQSTLVTVRRKLEWKLHFRKLARSSAEEPSIVVAICTSRLRWSMVQKRKSTQNSACDCKKSQPFFIYKTSKFWSTCFQDPMSLPFCTSLFSCPWMYSCRSVRLQRRDSEEKQSSVTYPVLVTDA